MEITENIAGGVGRVPPPQTKILATPLYNDARPHTIMRCSFQFGCFRGKFMAVTDDLTSRFCAKMLKETSQIATDGYAPNKQDIFMEHRKYTTVHELTN